MNKQSRPHGQQPDERPLDTLQRGLRRLGEVLGIIPPPVQPAYVPVIVRRRRLRRR